MELKRFWWWFMLVLFSLCINGCFGCLEEERIALLQLKASINYPNGSSLSGWDESANKLSDCCQWEGVECNNTTRHVIRLDLSFLMEYPTQKDRYLNASLFLPFHKLNYLDLSDNGISGWVPNEGFNRFSRLNKLEVLVLSDNHFNDSFLASISAVASLKKLYLRYNQLDQLISIPELGRLNNLKELYLDGSHIEKSFLQRAGILTSLNVLSIGDCGLSGSLPAQGWCELRNLQELDLSENELEGILPSCLANMTALRLLDLSSNHFNGSMPPSPLSSLQSLKYLVLSNNYFSPIRLSSFFNLSKLEVILSDNNEIVDEAESETWAPTFQLKVIILLNTSTKRSSGAIPRFLHYQHKLRVIDLSHNNLLGKFPTWLLKNNSRLELLNLRNNSFIGPFHVPYHPNPKIWSIDISDNHLRGPIPANLGTMPKKFAMGCSSLQYLRLSNNNFNGQIFPTSFNLTNLSYLYIDNNQFFGKIPNSLSGIDGTTFDFSNNYLSGELPRWMGNMSSLEEIAMAGNQLEGPIPLELCKLDHVLTFLDLSENYLSGSIPSCFNSSFIKHVHLNKNRLSGPIRNAFKDSFELVTLDLRENRLTGYLPNWIGNLSSLSILLLKANHLQGRIQNQLCLLGHLSMLDLSQNNFSGLIPHCLSNITFEVTDQKSDLDEGWYGDYDPVVETLLPYQGTKLNGILFRHFAVFYIHPNVDAQQVVEFTTKRRSYIYKGDILDYMSGIDLSCNSLSGGIPAELGNLSNIHALNLSFNNLTGSIPMKFSGLEQIESLDLSYNNLNGIIPPQLIELHSLAVFSVAHNNLSGTTPERKDQFGTFDESNYEGNHLLCGPPLVKSCTKNGAPSAMPADHEGEEGDSFSIDMVAFYISFVVSYAIVLMTIAAVLYINPYWRQVWFYFIEVCITNFYCFVVINFRKLSNFRSTT
ncbi:LRR receptor-like serine/threonine-protein kinase GSO2 [Morella rubra]|uniref:LRR receptor-like serine/threonine-protein kinase GSO2 n=1 Tax=Morella rubra TaxID=262757 RepID=A0A6A1WCT6_9ROSI|nr:LRR receptor-like serine/threonine-protein kinase GSO2 [Morella rubra]